jgi:hypothetical protein
MRSTTPDLTALKVEISINCLYYLFDNDKRGRKNNDKSIVGRSEITLLFRAL